MKIKILLLLSFTALMFACQSKSSSQAQSTVQQTAQPIQPAGTAGVDGPTIDVDVPSNQNPGEKKPFDPSSIKLTDETRISFVNYDTVEDFETKDAKDLNSYNCQMAKEKSPDCVIDELGTMTVGLGTGNAVLGVPLKAEYRRYCENGKLAQYNDHVILTVYVVQSIFGDLPPGEHEFLLRNHDPYDIVKLYQDTLYLFVFHDMGLGFYDLFDSHLLAVDYEGLRKPKSYPDFIPYKVSPGMHPTEWIPGSRPFDYCFLYNELPGRVGELKKRFSEHVLKGSALESTALWIKEDKEKLKQTHGEPGEPCNVEEDLRREEEERTQRYEEWRELQEKMIPKPKIVPCDNCPEGYEVEDLEIEEYLKEEARLRKLYGKGGK